MHDYNLLVEAIQQLLVDAVVQGILAKAWKILDLLPLQLNSEDVGDVAPFQDFVQVQFHLHPKAFNVLRNERDRSAYTNFCA